MKLMIDKPGARVWCLQSTETVSKADQQPLIFSMIPPEWRPISGRLKPKGDRSTKIVYSDADGFTKNSFILPNGSQCWFKFFAANVKTLEGAELDACWCFVAGTKVTIAGDRTRPIEQVKVGDEVRTQEGWNEVLAVGSRLQPVGRVTFSNGAELVGTAEHPVWVTGYGWQRLDNLLAGDKVEGSAPASVLTPFEARGDQEVFNLRVKDSREYYANGILVHNCDELVPPEWIEALIFRLVNRNGHLLITFTPVEHFSDTVKMYLSNAKTLETEKAELLPIFNAAGEIVNHENVPRIQQSGVASARVIYFHTADNPFGNYEGMKAELRGSPPERIKLRAYGIPTASQGSQFSFDESVHKIRHTDFLDLVRRYPDGSRYHLVDPCSGRNWFMGWAFCPYNVEVINADGSTSTQPKVIWYREWPSPGKYIEGIGEPGPWAVIGGTLVRHDGGKSPADGDRGPAQKPFRFGLKRYIDEFLRCERILNPITTKIEQEHITERWIDSRYAHAAVTDREEQTTLIEQLQSLGQIFMAMVSEQKILGVNDGSIDMINSALYYDKTIPIGQFSQDMGRANEPLMQVTDDCPNMIFALSNWTGLDGQSGACKDPIDLIRGFYLSRLCHVDASLFATRGGGCY